MAITLENKVRLLRKLEKSMRPHGMNKDDFIAAIDVALTFVNDNKLALNALLPQPFKGTASVKSKGDLLALAATLIGNDA